jgi:hypothetical protein
VQFKLPQPHLHSVGRCLRQRALGGEELDLLQGPAIFVEHLNGPNPLRALAVVDLTQIKHRLLHDLLAPTTPILHDRPISVLLAVFPPPCASQKHNGNSS